jgi:hypothetical protein
MFDHMDEIIKGLQKPTWEIGNQDKVVELEACVRELEAENQRLREAITESLADNLPYLTEQRLKKALEAK